MFCKDCGAEISDNAEICPKCGCRQKECKVVVTTFQHNVGSSNKSRLVAAVLCFFLGGIGVHRFYVGKIGTGILMLLTFGGFGVSVLIDFILICCGSFEDEYGRPLLDWD